MKKMTESVFFSNIFSAANEGTKIDFSWQDVKRDYNDSLKESCDCGEEGCKCKDGECDCADGECECKKEDEADEATNMEESKETPVAETEKMTEATFFSNVFASSETAGSGEDLDWRDVKKSFVKSLKG